jgi:hypothetical protein
VRTSSLLLLFAYIPLAAQPPVSTAPSSASNDVVPAFSASGAIKLPATHFELEITHPNAFTERGDLTVVYDPQNRFYLWRYMNLLPPYIVSHIYGLRDSDGDIYADAAGLVGFFAYPTVLEVKVSTLRADSFDAAARASAGEAQRELSVLQPGYFERGTGEHLKAVDVDSALAGGFRCLQYMDSTCRYQPTTIPSVEKQGTSWRLVLRNRWDQEIILDSKFNFVSTQRLPSPQN